MGHSAHHALATSLIVSKTQGALWPLRDLMALIRTLLTIVAGGVGAFSLIVMAQTLFGASNALPLGVMCGAGLRLAAAGAIVFLADWAQQFTLMGLAALAVSAAAPSQRVALPGAVVAAFVTWLVNAGLAWFVLAGAARPASDAALLAAADPGRPRPAGDVHPGAAAGPGPGRDPAHVRPARDRHPVALALDLTGGGQRLVRRGDRPALRSRAGMHTMNDIPPNAAVIMRDRYMSRILIVEDDEQLQQVLGMTLKRLGHEVHGSSNGVDGSRHHPSSPI